MSKIDPNKLLISSDFYTIQGEGISSGIPAYFVRLGICNLTCGMSRAFTNALAKEASLEDGEIFEGDLVKEGKATWTCDSTSQWLWRGEDKEFQYLIDRWREEDVYDDILEGNVHIIWTGGEPTIKGHQVAICNFLKYWQSIEVSDQEIIKVPFHEIETNGTVIIEDELFSWLSQINCSPKLANSGMTEKQRIVPAAIKRIMQHNNYQFKFVVSNEEDMEEIMRDFVKPFNIPLKNVVIMPGLDDSANFEERTRFSLEMAKRYKVRGLTRLHIAAWNKTLNV
jgi:7-carboxy-7-deazaguanine synthase